MKRMMIINAAGAVITQPGIELHFTANSAIKVTEVLNDYPGLKDELFKRLDPTRPGGSLVLISGGAGNGKTTTAAAIIEDVASRVASNDQPLRLAYVGIVEHLYSRAITILTGAEESCLVGECATAPVIFYDQFYGRSGKMAFEALSMAMAGRKVIGVIHGNFPQDGVDRLRQLLVGFGVGESFLNDLIDSGRVFSVYQTLKSVDASRGVAGEESNTTTSEEGKD
jgi:predicted PilT family ATPase